MHYPFKYPNLYGELAKQGITKKEFAEALHITMAGLRYKQSIHTEGDFLGEEIRAASAYLNQPADYLFSTEETTALQALESGDSHPFAPASEAV